MTAILTPALALRHLRELSTDLRAAVVLDASGRLLAGEAVFHTPARELLGVLDDTSGGEGRELIVPLEEGGTLRGTAIVARADGPPGADPALATVAAPAPAADAPPEADAGAAAIVVAAGPHALLDLLRHDLATALYDLAAGGPTDAAAAVVDSPAPLPAHRPAVVAIGASRSVQTLEPADFAGRTAIFAGMELLAAGNPANGRGEAKFPAIARKVENE